MHDILMEVSLVQIVWKNCESVIQVISCVSLVQKLCVQCMWFTVTVDLHTLQSQLKTSKILLKFSQLWMMSTYTKTSVALFSVFVFFNLPKC